MIEDDIKYYKRKDKRMNNMEKKTYEAVVVEVVALAEQDVLTSSLDLGDWV